MGLRVVGSIRVRLMLILLLVFLGVGLAVGGCRSGGVWGDCRLVCWAVRCGADRGFVGGEGGVVAWLLGSARCVFCGCRVEGCVGVARGGV